MVQTNVKWIEIQCCRSKRRNDHFVCTNNKSKSLCRFGLFRAKNMNFKYEIGDYYLNEVLYEIVKKKVLWSEGGL